MQSDASEMSNSPKQLRKIHCQTTIDHAMSMSLEPKRAKLLLEVSRAGQIREIIKEAKVFLSPLHTLNPIETRPFYEGKRLRYNGSPEYIAPATSY